MLICGLSNLHVFLYGLGKFPLCAILVDLKVVCDYNWFICSQNWKWIYVRLNYQNRQLIYFISEYVFRLPSSHGATDSFSLALRKIVSGSGKECRTIAPYKPYSAIMVLLPQHFSVLRHFALRFWNHTCETKRQPLDVKKKIDECHDKTQILICNLQIGAPSDCAFADIN